ncbi:MAG: glycosyltransferase family 2 protein [Candidatus Omnitrophica bacterium]|nr:glycosyltransferase family 2 protein [Candidatus Omnitrophota bacterium]
MPEQNVDYSIIVPVHNEEGSLKPLFSELLRVMTPLNQSYEIVFVNDGSCDRSAEIMDGFAKEFPEVVRVIHLPQRSGQTFGLRTGLDASRGEVAVTLDADLQNDPADIPKMLEEMREGNYDCVCGWRKARQDTLLKAGLSKSGNILQRLFTGMSIHDVSCTLRIYKRDCIDKIALNWEGQHRFIPLSLSLQGYRVGEIVSNHRLRQFGATKYSHKRIFRVITDFFKVLRAKGKK